MSSIVVAGNTSGSVTLQAPDVSGSSVLTLPVATDTLVGKNTTDTLTNKTVDSLNGGQLAGLRNKIINGNMDIAQRGTAAVTTSGAYGPADRFVNYAAGDTFSTTIAEFVSGDVLYDTGGARYYTTIAVTSVAGAGNYITWLQSIENVRILAGQTVTVSFWAKAASGTPLIGVELYQSFGTGGSPSAGVNGVGQSVTLSTTWTKYTKTITLGSINGKTIGTDANSSCTQLDFWLDAGATHNTRSGSIGQASKTVSIAQVQLEIGSVATPFEQRPIGMELALCQRYYSVVSGISCYGYAVGGSNSVITTVPLPVSMRAAPAITITSNGAITAGWSINANGIGTTAFGIQLVSNAAGPGGTIGAAISATQEL